MKSLRNVVGAAAVALVLIAMTSATAPGSSAAAAATPAPVATPTPGVPSGGHKHVLQQNGPDNCAVLAGAAIAYLAAGNMYLYGNAVELMIEMGCG